ncbi:MAG TPA: hypothetical protein VKY90_21290 [Candidatus Dormibacteraeota bacterium]|nr:hypothetical protein [Candidatus Dormibacteraeota bacterium]
MRQHRPWAGDRCAPGAEREAIVERFVALAGLTGFEERCPHELSGGMKQRAAVARRSPPTPWWCDGRAFAVVDAQAASRFSEELLRISMET